MVVVGSYQSINYISLQIDLDCLSGLENVDANTLNPTN